MQDNPSPSALAIRRATRVRELNKMRRTQLEPLLFQIARSHGYDYAYLAPGTPKERIISSILEIEGLDMAVLS